MSLINFSVREKLVVGGIGGGERLAARLAAVHWDSHWDSHLRLTSEW